MKTLVPILFMIILINSCKKDPCYTCETIKYSSYDDSQLSFKSEIVCTKSETEILNYQIDRYDFSDPASYTTCKCTKQ
jgi:hypothetical protein